MAKIQRRMSAKTEEWVEIVVVATFVGLVIGSCLWTMVALVASKLAPIVSG